MPASVHQLMSGCGFPSAPILTCTLPVMGQPAVFGVHGSVAAAAGVVRLFPFKGALFTHANLAGSVERCDVYLNSESFVLARFATDGNGDFAFSHNIPPVQVLCGSRWVVQGLFYAPSGQNRFGASNALLLQFGN